MIYYPFKIVYKSGFSRPAPYFTTCFSVSFSRLHSQTFVVGGGRSRLVITSEHEHNPNDLCPGSLSMGFLFRIPSVFNAELTVQVPGSLNVHNR